VAQAVRRMLSQHEQQIKKCARGGAGGVTAFKLQIPGNASRVENIRTATSSDMDSCLRAVLDGDFGAEEKEPRQGMARFELTSKNGVIERCNIRVTLRSKAKRGQRKPKTDKNDNKTKNRG
jgi:hypothetical protein